MKEGYSLRPYQSSAVDFVEEVMQQDNVNSAIVVRPTGTGKTIIFSAIIEKEVESGGKVLVLAHRNKLLSQAHDKLMSSCGIDASYEGKDGGDERVVICSIQSMSKDNRLEKYGPEYFSMIVIDETHHIASPSYRKVIEHFSTAKVIGVTATPVRGDGYDTRKDFDRVGPEYSTEDAINDGYLTPVSVLKIPVSIDISRVKMQGGDYSASEVGNVLESYLEKIAIKTAELAKGKKIVIFTPLVSTAETLSSLFNFKTEVVADYVAGNRKDSDEVLEKFERGEIDVLCNAMLLTEGYDCPSIDCVINLRPTKSKSLYTQMIGRALRLCDGKDHATVMDFLWQDNGRGNLSAQDALLDTDDPFVKDAMEKMVEELEEGEEIDIHKLKALAEEKAIKEREAALADALEKANRLAEGRTKAFKELLEALTKYALEKSEKTGESPLNIYGVIKKSEKVIVKYHCLSASIVAVGVKDPVLECMGLDKYYSKIGGGDWEQDPPSMKQLSLLEKLGLPVGYAVSKGHAAFLINGFLDRNNEGLCSYKQLKSLIKFNVKDPECLTKTQAKNVLEQKFGKRRLVKKKKG